MFVSLAPSYHCNFNCPWCYLSTEQLRNKDKIDLAVLDNKLGNLGHIEQVDIYGGEPGTLPPAYAKDMINIICKHTDKINVISNLSVIPDWYYLPEITSIGVSYDWDQREQHNKVLTNMILIQRSVAVLMLATEKLIKVDPCLIATTFNNIGNIQSLEIKPYSQNQFNSFDMNFRHYEEWIKRWINLDQTGFLKFQLQNTDILERSVTKEYNAYSDNHLYIDPYGNYSVLDFDLNDKEYFRVIKDLAEYKLWCNKERTMVESNKFCNKCKWVGHCATEHYRNVKSIDNSCNGFKLLLDWYDALED